MRTKQPTKCIVPLQKLGMRLARKTSLSPQKIITDRSKAVVLLWFFVVCFWCQSFGDVPAHVCSYFSSVSVAEWPPFGK